MSLPSAFHAFCYFLNLGQLFLLRIQQPRISVRATHERHRKGHGLVRGVLRVRVNLDKDHAYLYIDVGGGSTELTFFAGNKLLFSASFNIGTIRLLKKQVTESQWDSMKDYIKRETKDFFSNIVAIGSGGNINKIFSISKRKEGKSLHVELLKDYYKEFASFSLEDRMRLYKLREDRADVIVPALQIYINVMRWANSPEIYVPKIGLADGLIQHLYADLKRKGAEI